MRLTPAAVRHALREANGDTAVAAVALGVSRRTVQRWKSMLSKAEDKDLPLYEGTTDSPEDRPQLNGKRFVFTVAQNNTEVHRPFLDALLHYCNETEARLCVARCTYNIAGFQNLSKDREGLWYDPAVLPYCIDGSFDIAPGLVFYDMNILPTAVRPLSGLHSITRGCSGIIPHVKMAMESIPTTQDNEHCTMLYTTGAVTLRNYIQQKAGQKANFHHVFGAVVVEVDDCGTWFVRQLIANKDGAFHDLDTCYTASGSTRMPCTSIVLGDVHAPSHDCEAWLAAMNMVSALDPSKVVLHDLLDFHVASPHTRDNSLEQFSNVRNERTVESELQAALSCVQQVARYTSEACTIVVAPSNHPHMMFRWLRDADYRKDPTNACTFLEWQGAMYQAMKHGADPEDAFWGLWRAFLCPEGYPFRWRMRVLQPDEPMWDADVAIGMHGHLGPCGARGNVANLSRINTKCTIGHTHAATIRDGCYSVGTLSKLKMGYNQGPSNWSHSCVVQYANGKRSIITIKDGKWRA